MTDISNQNGKCPKCGGVSGFTTNDYFTGWATCMGDWNGDDAEYPNFNDTVTAKRISKTVLCLDCNKRVPRPIYWLNIEGEL